MGKNEAVLEFLSGTAFFDFKVYRFHQSGFQTHLASV